MNNQVGGAFQVSIKANSQQNQAVKPKCSKSMVFEPSSKIVEFEGQLTVLELALKNQIEMDHSCGGMGSCGTCRVLVRSDLSQLPKPNEIEQDMIEDRDFAPEERLACQLCAYDKLIVSIED